MLKLFLRKYSARDLNMFLINKPIDDPENLRLRFVDVNEYTPANVTQRIICATDMSAKTRYPNGTILPVGRFLRCLSPIIIFPHFLFRPEISSTSNCLGPC